MRIEFFWTERFVLPTIQWQMWWMAESWVITVDDVQYKIKDKTTSAPLSTITIINFRKPRASLKRVQIKIVRERKQEIESSLSTKSIVKGTRLITFVYKVGPVTCFVAVLGKFKLWHFWLQFLLDMADVVKTLENATEEVAKNATEEKIPATPEGMFVAYSSLFFMAVFCIYIGSIKSVKHHKTQKVRQIQFYIFMIPIHSWLIHLIFFALQFTLRLLTYSRLLQFACKSGHCMDVTVL